MSSFRTRNLIRRLNESVAGRLAQVRALPDHRKILDAAGQGRNFSKGFVKNCMFPHFIHILFLEFPPRKSRLPCEFSKFYYFCSSKKFFNGNALLPKGLEL